MEHVLFVLGTVGHCFFWWLHAVDSSPKLGGGFKHFVYVPLFGKMIQFDKEFSDGLKPPSSYQVKMMCLFFQAAFL